MSFVSFSIGHPKGKKKKTKTKKNPLKAEKLITGFCQKDDELNNQ